MLFDRVKVEKDYQKLIIKSFLEPLVDVVVTELLPEHERRRVGAISQRYSTEYWGLLDMWEYIVGFKDGVVQLTGVDSKLYYCNKNITDTKNVFYYNWLNIFGSYDIITTKWTTTGYQDATFLLMQYTQKVFRWPYNVLYNCYWANIDLVYRYENMNVPLFFQDLKADKTGYEAVGFWVSTFLNIVFNMGYQVRDTIWLVQLTTAMPDYWYRYGFVAGDVYMRFFFRSTYDAPLKLKT